MNMKLQTLLALTLLGSASLSAQTTLDALRFSQVSPGGTARALGAGSSLGAIGDMSGISVNPASIGCYRFSEFSFSSGVDFTGIKSTLNGNSTTDSRARFVVNNTGFVAVTRKDNEADWRSVNWGMTINRTADFNQNFNFNSGSATNGSITERWVADANGTSRYRLDPFDNRLAFENYLLDYAGDSLTYTSVAPTNGTFKKESNSSTGGITDYNFTLGANYKDKIYIGGGLTLSGLRYDNKRVYRETDGNTTNYFESLEYIEYLKTRGTGFNAKIGMIVRPVNWLRLGLGLQSPTFYSLRDNYSTSLSSDVFYFNNNTNTLERHNIQGMASPKGDFRYSLTTPLKSTLSTAFIIKKFGFVTAEAEWLPYSASRFAAADADYTNTNQSISKDYTSGYNVRLGAEYAYQIFRFRAGYGYYSTPFANKVGIENAVRQTFSGGFGIFNKKFFADIAYMHSMADNGYSPYLAVTEAQYVKNKTTSGNFVLTIGWKIGE